MSSIEPEIRTKMMNLLSIEESKTDLDNLAVLSRVGMKVASATSAELDADATSASSTALIDLGLRLAEATAHGSLMEILLHNSSGYSILMAINDEYIVFSGLKATNRIGYYLGYLREMAKKLKILISGDEITEMALKLEESELERLRQQEEEEEEASMIPQLPSIEQDKEALGDLLGFLDDWGGEETKLDLGTGLDSNIVGIPDSLSVGLPEPGGSVGLPEPGGSVGLPDDLPTFDDLEIDTEIGIPEPAKPAAAAVKSDFKVYPDEIPPVPLEDYTPMDVEEEPAPVSAAPAAAEPSPYVYESTDEGVPEELPPLDELPSFDELGTPDFGEISTGTEYDTEFILGEESETLDSVLEELGWDEED